MLRVGTGLKWAAKKDEFVGLSTNGTAYRFNSHNSFAEGTPKHVAAREPTGCIFTDEIIKLRENFLHSQQPSTIYRAFATQPVW